MTGHYLFAIRYWIHWKNFKFMQFFNLSKTVSLLSLFQNKCFLFLNEYRALVYFRIWKISLLFYSADNRDKRKWIKKLNPIQKLNFYCSQTTQSNGCKPSRQIQFVWNKQLSLLLIHLHFTVYLLFFAQSKETVKRLCYLHHLSVTKETLSVSFPTIFEIWEAVSYHDPM